MSVGTMSIADHSKATMHHYYYYLFIVSLFWVTDCWQSPPFGRRLKTPAKSFKGGDRCQT
jgi:hypothetical protein